MIGMNAVELLEYVTDLGNIYRALCKAKPDFVFIPSYWLTGNEHILRRLALSISRRIKDPIDKWMAVRTAGSLTLVINYDRAYVCGPVDEKKIKARVYAEQPNLGWLRIRPKGIEIGGF